MRLPELVWIVDPATGDLVVEGLEAEEALALAGDLLPLPRELNCARPLATAPLPEPGGSIAPVLRVAPLWHGSVVEGPGRRSVLQVQGCPLRCSRLVLSTQPAMLATQRLYAQLGFERLPERDWQTDAGGERLVDGLTR